MLFEKHMQALRVHKYVYNDLVMHIDETLKLIADAVKREGQANFADKIGVDRRTIKALVCGSAKYIDVLRRAETEARKT